MWLTLGLKLLGIGKTIMGWLREALRWVLSDWRHIVIAVLAALVLYNALAADKWQARTEKALVALERANKTISDMKAASEAAKQAALANAARVEAEYKEIAKNAKISYDRALADNRASVERWKLQNRRGATRQGDSSAAAEVSPGTVGAETLPIIPRGFVLLPESDLDKTADIQATLYGLQQAARDAQEVQTAPD